MDNLMSEVALKKAVPAAFTTERSMTRTSERYAFINTMDVVERLIGEGYCPIDAQQDRPRQRDPRHVRHRIVMRQNGVKPLVGGIVPQLIITNSHNGRTKLKIQAGLYRFVCANGLVVGDDKFMEAISHRSDAPAVAVDFAQKVAAQLADLSRVTALWNQLQMDVVASQNYARAAAEARFGTAIKGAYKPETILEARREEDKGRNLWTVYNVVQENLVKGGIEGQTASGRRTTARGIKDIGADLRFNEWLWDFTHQTAEAMEAA